MAIMHFNLQRRKEEAKEKEMKMYLFAAINSCLEKQVKKTNQKAGDRAKKKQRQKKFTIKAVNEERKKK